ncbi:DUF4338 domain-containing protein [Desulfallas sp. Bu1-1]|uniref:DUF4338 domain-containing protein n=1 Tax=Desulfallas sp. Bu1-1 TaxID=2787620 RepID=UPI0018A05B70|nr:DUF4338 domain-containing protein [Desulfallas sp. Bu1-1]MBF7083014.1 DUF4338 domain-containing protein [Desulfallas sp. Bu1-1]
MKKVRYCGRDFTAAELDLIRSIIARPEEHPTRAAIARAVCQSLAWVKPDGDPKLMSARVALLRMHRDGLLELPPPRGGNGNGRWNPQPTPATDPGPTLTGTRRDLGPLALHRVARPKDSRLWNELIARYHYLGYTSLPGAQIRYLIRNETHLLGAIGMGAAAWKVAPRDLFIGWTPIQREQRLHLVINQARFLILPWVQVKNLASSILSLLAAQVASDWEELYAYRPVLMETFVEQNRFHGTCYRAANWIYVGQTQGRGKLDTHKLKDKPIKDIFLFPLDKNFRNVLTAPT